MVVLSFPQNIESFKQIFPAIVQGVFQSPEDIAEHAKLIIFPGGADIDPFIYGQRNTYSITHYYRDLVELEMLRLALLNNIKIVGICRGHQLINAHLGGELVQDLKNCGFVQHKGTHSLDIQERDDRFLKTIPDGIVNSTHHQGVIKEGEGQIVTAYHEGIIESTISRDIATFQFHPEFRPNYRLFDEIKEWAGL